MKYDPAPNASPLETTPEQPQLDLSYRSSEEGDLESNIQSSLEALELEMDKGSAKLGGSVFFRTLYRIDSLDKHYSRILHEHTSVYANVVLTVWAHFFNRGQIVMSILFSMLTGSIYYNTWLENLGYKPIERELTTGEQARFGIVFMLTYMAALIALVISTQAAKYSIRRPRPDRIPNTPRWGKDLRAHENGTFAMPSGDAAAGAIFCFLYCHMLGFPAVWIILPLVCAGRVYY